MNDKPRNKPTKPKGAKSMAAEMRKQKIIEGVMAGKTATAVAKDVGMCRQQVSKILNAEETKEFLRARKQRVLDLVDAALEGVELAIQTGDADLTNSLKACLSVLKTHSLINEKQTLEIVPPKPTIIERADGSQVILTTEDEEKK